ncbi:MAG: glycosyltransferase family 4 protein [bacterium]|nr:glycosyltransferase family 4 protein [bacterium]
MKILTNVRFAQVAGIAQTLSSFIGFIEQSKNKAVKIVGVDVLSNGRTPQQLKEGNFALISGGVTVPHIVDTIKTATKISDIQIRYQEVIEAYRRAIIREKPDVILINGTYYLPWCLLHASRDFSIPTILHYHGSITKETEHWKQEGHRKLFREMEQQFDHSNMFYIFPSNLTKSVVETEVFKHQIDKYSILPNPVPAQFFLGKPKGRRKHIGVVGRWTRIKNPNFINRLARYNAKHGGEFDMNIVTDLGINSKPMQDLAGLATFKRSMNNEKLSNFYASMGVVVSPSHFETYGNVAKEALASGVPAFVSSSMGVAETFRELGLEAWITDFRSVKDVYAKIKDVSGQEVPMSARKQLLEKHSANHINGKMLKILKSV